MRVVECAAASRRYHRRGAPDVVAVREADLHVDSGEVVAIQGPSGSGKTTLLGLLSGLEAADSGTVTVLGHELARLSATERARLRQRRVGVVFQTFGLVASLSAIENVALPLALAGRPESATMERSSAVLDEVGLARLRDARIDDLSGGERQRVAVARALAIEPQLILADEPTGSLDESHGRAVLELLIAATRSRGASLVLVTHDPMSAGLADRRYAMRDGHIAAEHA
jgi:putative ABC transport system ATP-binding protein